ncbi:hypothetical protein [Lichenifustis flavocetrariae]|uniref:Uncharacterized protein n=1 Tax=Lichenifustis flavocetrariae TaxID=2949735 RepID=A0AA41ZB24_9HYPH|nr:hypothetical protein [Lichenifustis flavocetrariae]MCW6512612.1 hypothetical protein [Lichenifustis flavocetrariae]
MIKADPHNEAILEKGFDDLAGAWDATPEMIKTELFVEMEKRACSNRLLAGPEPSEATYYRDVAEQCERLAVEILGLPNALINKFCDLQTKLYGDYASLGPTCLLPEFVTAAAIDRIGANYRHPSAEAWLMALMTDLETIIRGRESVPPFAPPNFDFRGDPEDYLPW